MESSYRIASHLDDAVEALTVLHQINSKWPLDQYKKGQSIAQEVMTYYDDHKETIDFVELVTKLNESSWCQAG